MRYFYAIEYAYGSQVINRGGRPDLVHRFTSKWDRDRFVLAGNFQGPGERRRLRADRPAYRQAQAKAAAGLEWPIAV